VLLKVAQKTRRLVFIVGFICLVAGAEDDHDKAKPTSPPDTKAAKGEAPTPEVKVSPADILKKWKELDEEKGRDGEFVAKLEKQLATNVLNNQWPEKNESEAHWNAISWFRENFSIEQLEQVIASPREYGVESASALKLLKAMVEMAKKNPADLFETALDENPDRDPWSVEAAKRELDHLQKNPDELKKKLEGLTPEEQQKFGARMDKLGKAAAKFMPLLQWAKQAVQSILQGKPVAPFGDTGDGNHGGADDKDPTWGEGADHGGGAGGGGRGGSGGGGFGGSEGFDHGPMTEDGHMVPHGGGTTVDLENNRYRPAKGPTKTVVENSSKPGRGSDFVRECKENKELIGKSFEWGRVPELCRDPACPAHGSNRIGGKITMVDENKDGKGELVFEVPKIQFIYPDNPAQAESMMKQMDKLLECAANFFARQVGVDKVKFNVEHNPVGKLKSTDPVIRIDPTAGRSNCNQFHLGNHSSYLCPVLTHELLHRIAGLPDRYVDEDCPGRNPNSSRFYDSSNIGPWWSIMANNTAGSKIRLEPDHEKAFLKNLCTKPSDKSVPSFCQ